MYCRKIRSAKKVYAFSLFLRGKVVVVEGKVKKKITDSTRSVQREYLKETATARIERVKE